jgi:hypothetical protein
MPNFKLAASLTLLSCTALLAQKTSQPIVTVARGVDVRVIQTEQLVIPAADALPEELYGFAPTAGEFAGVRTFAEQVKHLAATNYQLAALALGEQPPVGTANETAPPTVRTKAQIMEYLRGSFASLHRAALLINPQNLEEPVVVGGSAQIRVGLIIDALAHAQNHYGQIVEYLRMNRIVPPASR